MADTTTNQKWGDVEEKRTEKRDAREREQDANAQCAVSASEEGERWQRSTSLMIASCWVMTLSAMTPIPQRRPHK